MIFPLMASLAGMLGGVFGIGGGMLISPLLLQVGITPEVTSNSIFNHFHFIMFVLNCQEYLFLLSCLDAGNSSNLFFHGVLLSYNVIISVCIVGHGTDRHCPHLGHSLFCCITSWIGSGAESNSRIWEGISHCILSKHCDGFEYRPND